MTQYSRAGRPAAAVEEGMLKGLVNVLASQTLDVNSDATLHRLYRVPDGKQLITLSVVLHSNTGSLLGMTDVDFGGGADAASPAWKDAANFTSMTTANSIFNMFNGGAAGIIDGDNSTEANRWFNALVNSGSTGAALVTMDVVGYLIDS